ncbi:MAG: protein kinase domain-containing protein [Panacagrimonas sp.]
MTQIGTWLDELQQGSLGLPELAAKVDQRGAISESEHRLELAELATLMEAGKLDRRLHQALSTKLAQLQRAGSADSDDRTVMSSPPPPSAPDGDHTVMFPSPPTPSDSDRTVLNTPPAGPDDVTQLREPDPTSTDTAPTASNTGGTSPSTGTSSSGSRASSWKRLAETDAPSEQVGVGSRLKDRFVLEQMLGQGGMGVVYLALDERKVEARDRNPRVAVKVLNDEFRRHPDSLIALQRESRRSQQLAHDNIVRVYDFDKDGTIVFMTMEYVDGEDLKVLIRSLDGKGLPMAQAYPIIEGMGRALERAHRDGVVHSDFKPGNVMLTQDRVPKVFDFGIARAGKHRGETAGEQTLFDASTLGALTPAYASLEMLQGVDAEPADDLYALAIVAYELLSGIHPFNKLNAEQAQKQALVPKRIDGLSNLAWRTLCRGLAFQRKDRIASAGELIEGLRPRTLRERALPLVLSGVSGVAVLAVLGWGGTTLYYRHKVQSVEDCIGSTECADAAVLTQRLHDLNDDDQVRISEARRDEIKGIFHSTLAQHWSPDQNRYDHRQAADVVKLAFGLYGADSAWVKELGDGLEASRNTTLSRLNDEFSRQIEQDAFGKGDGKDRGLLAILDAVRAIDSTQPLLKDGRIGPALERSIRSTLDAAQLNPAQQLDAAQKQLEIAQRYVSDAEALKPLTADLAARREQIETAAREEQRLAAARSAREQRIAVVSQVLAQAADSAQWRSKLRDAWVAARESVPADDPELLKLGQSLASTLLAQSTRAQTGGDLETASESARLGVELLPGNASLERQLGQLDQARDRLIAQAQSEVEREQLKLARLDQLLQRPVATTAWIDDVDATLKTFAETDPAKSQAQREAFARGIEQSVTQALGAGDFDKAQSLAERGAASASVGRQLAALPKRVSEARAQAQAKQIERLRELTREKAFTAEWQKSVESAVAALRAANDQGLPALLESLGAAYAERADKLVDEKSYAAARQIADAGARVVPKSAAIQASQARIAQVEQNDKVARDRQQLQFKIEELERTVALKAAASEINDAVAALQQLRKLDPSNRFATGDGPKQIADGAQKLAERFASARDFGNAVKAVDRGLEVLPGSTTLIQSRARYETGACAADLERETRKAGALTAPRKSECLALLKKQDPALYAKYRGLETAVVPTPPPPAVTPTPAPTPPVVAPVAPPPVAAPAPETRTTATGPDPCKKGFAGDGTRTRAQCNDDAGGVKGPNIVVVSGLGTYGITQTELWAEEFARYCRSAGQPCPAMPADGYLPVTNVSIDQAKGYARWLSSVTGRRYRLPTAGEWRHAASVGGRDVFSDGYCKDESGGAGPHQITAGVMNKWGLVNSVGNVWELVDDGGSAMAVGGSFQEDSRSCDADARRAYEGPDPAIGFRLVRELDE